MLETSRQHGTKENPFNYQRVLLPYLTIPNLLIATEKPSHTLLHTCLGYTDNTGSIHRKSLIFLNLLICERINTSCNDLTSVRYSYIA